MKTRTALLILTLALFQGCGGDADPAPDFIARQAYSSENELVPSSKSESGKTELHFRLESKEAAQNVFIRLDIGDASSVQSSSTRPDHSTILRLHEGGPEYRFDHRDLFKRAPDWHGKLLPIETFRHPSG